MCVLKKPRNEMKACIKIKNVTMYTEQVCVLILLRKYCLFFN